MTKAPVFPLVMKIVFGGVEFNPILAKIGNCHCFSDSGVASRRLRAEGSISTASRRRVQRHAAAGIMIARRGASGNAEPDDGEK